MNEREEGESVLLYHCPTCGATHLDPVEDAENAALRQQLADRWTEIDGLNDQAAELHKKLAEARAEVEDAKNEIADLKTQRSYLVGQLDNKEREKDEFKKMIRMWQESVKRHRLNLDKVRDCLGMKITERDEQLAAQAAELERMRKELAQSTNYITDDCEYPHHVWFANGRHVELVYPQGRSILSVGMQLHEAFSKKDGDE